LIDFLEDPHLLHLSVAFGAIDFCGDVPHVRKMDVVGDLIYTNPRNGLLVGPVLSHLGDLGLLPLIGATDDLMAPDACPDWRNSGVYRPLCREMAVLAVDPVGSGMNIMWKSDWLNDVGCRPVRRFRFLRRTAVLGLNKRQRTQDGERNDRCTYPSLCHKELPPERGVGGSKSDMPETAGNYPSLRVVSTLRERQKRTFFSPRVLYFSLLEKGLGEPGPE
jgi:hypothetical protein